jgi:hypothetical protein
VGCECTRCGKCCISIGRYIRIEQRDGQHIRAVMDLTHERFRPRVSPEYHSLSSMPGGPGWCPFLRKVPGEDTFTCIIYPSRPAYCREFHCCRGVIRDREGKVVGKVKGRRSLESGDPALRGLWEEYIAPLTGTDDTAWISMVKEKLLIAGYSVELCDS